MWYLKKLQGYMEGFSDLATGEARRGYLDVIRELQDRFPKPDGIVKEKEKRTSPSFSANIFE
jgi:type I restriction enzyme R subunit